MTEIKIKQLDQMRCGNRYQIKLLQRKKNIIFYLLKRKSHQRADNGVFLFHRNLNAKNALQGDKGAIEACVQIFYQIFFGPN